MTRRTLEISGRDTRLSFTHRQLLIERDGREVGRVPIEDIGLLILDQPTTSYTHWVLSEILAQGGAIIFCGPDHLPVGTALPTSGHHLQAERFRAQLAATEPRRKRLWQQIIQAKIANHGRMCRDGPARVKLERLGQSVRSGDPDNIEAQAARVHWRAWMPETGFRRVPRGPFPNALLDYGYAILRASVARALVAAGFHPSLGIQHSNRYNAFALADDLMEPLRPAVDSTARALVRNNARRLDQTAKKALLELLYLPYESPRGRGPLFNALDHMTASFHDCLLGRSRFLDIPTIPLPAERHHEPDQRIQSDVDACDV